MPDLRRFDLTAVTLGRRAYRRIGTPAELAGRSPPAWFCISGRPRPWPRRLGRGLSRASHLPGDVPLRLACRRWMIWRD